MAISLPIVSKFDDKGLNEAERGLSRLDGVAKAAGAAIAAGLAVATAAAVALSIESVKAASSFQETTAAVNEVFGESAKELENFAKTANKSLAQSQTQFLQSAKTFGIFGKAAGLADEQNAEFSKNLTILATDLASFNDTTVDEAITALGAALRGESEPIRRYGVLLDDATLKSRAMEMGIYDGNGALTQQQRVLAANAEIFAQTSTQQGDFARTSDGAANATRTLQATFENLKITIGNALLPAVEALLPQLTGFIENLATSPEFNDFLIKLAENFELMLPQITANVEQLMKLGIDTLPILNEIIPTLTSILGALSSAIGIVTSATSTMEGPLLNAISALDGIASSAGFAFDGLNTLATYIGGEEFGSDWAILLDLLNPVTTALRIMGEGADLTKTSIKLLKGEFTNATDALNAFKNAMRGIPIIGQFVGPNISYGDERRRPMADGGIVFPRAGGVPVTVAEAGEPEAIIPLNRFQEVTGFSGGSKAVVNITVNAGMGTDGAAVGEQIVNAIRRYERTSGAVFARA